MPLHSLKSLKELNFHTNPPPCSFARGIHYQRPCQTLSWVELWFYGLACCYSWRLGDFYEACLWTFKPVVLAGMREWVDFDDCNKWNTSTFHSCSWHVDLYEDGWMGIFKLFMRRCERGLAAVWGVFMWCRWLVEMFVPWRYVGVNIAMQTKESMCFFKKRLLGKQGW